MHRRAVGRRIVIAACALVLSFALFGACTGTSVVRLKRERTGSVLWNPCGPIQCGSLSVPLDAKHPNGTRITLALGRLPATGHRVGVLFTNPGGPGASGVDFIRDARAIFPAAILKAFDIVSWDPRGVGKSAPIRCNDQLDAFYAVDRSPDSAGDIDANVKAAKAFVASCVQGSGKLLPFVSTRNSARDLDAIRAAIGEQQISYLGFSYGTYLGARYAAMFPSRVRAMVLDGAVDPARSYADTVVQQAAGFERELQGFFTDCRNDPDCGFATGGDPERAFDSLSRDVDAEPQYAKVHGERRILGPGEFEIGVASALYAGHSGYQSLANALAQTASGLGNKMAAFADQYTGRKTGGKYTNETAALYAIGCVDAPSPRTVAGMQTVAARATRAAPHFGASTTWLGLPCAYWPVPAQEKIEPIHARGAPAILVVGTRGDPATPYSWAVSLAQQLSSGRLLTYDGDGHTAYGSSDCVDTAVNDYLLKLTPPAKRTSCK
jgi:pimeloyl-ACP methyl ester carboxylesterase